MFFFYFDAAEVAANFGDILSCTKYNVKLHRLINSKVEIRHILIYCDEITINKILNT